MPFGEVRRPEKQDLSKTQAYLNSFLQANLDEKKKEVDKKLRADAVTRVQSFANLLNTPKKTKVTTNIPIVGAPEEEKAIPTIPIANEIETYRKLTDTDVLTKYAENSTQNPMFDQYAKTYLSLYKMEQDKEEMNKKYAEKGTAEKGNYEVKEISYFDGKKKKNMKTIQYFNKDTGKISQEEIVEDSHKDFRPNQPRNGRETYRNSWY